MTERKITIQQFVRTVNTTDAFKLKMEQLEKEYKLKLDEIDKEIAAKQKELDQFAGIGVGGELGGGFLRFISWIAFVLGGLGFILALIGLGVDGPEKTKENLPIVIGVVLFGIFMVVLGAIWRSKGTNMLLRAAGRKEEAERKSKLIEAELEQLRSKRKQLDDIFQQQMLEQQQIFQQHMLNQQELIQKEVQTINNDDTKECPQCAEIIKLKAKICRYCNYQFNE